MAVDILAFAAHPDDIEITCGGLLLTLKRRGYTTGGIDFTRGEFGSNGTVEERQAECAAATRILSLDHRSNFGFPDGKLSSFDLETMKAAAVRAIRTHTPRILVLPDRKYRHPDHGMVAKVGYEAHFYAGLMNYLPEMPPYRPKLVIYAPYNRRYHPSFIVDVSDVVEEKLEAIKAYRSQLFTGDTKADTPLSHRNFIDRIRASMMHYGSMANVAYGEPYLMESPPAVTDVISAFGLSAKK
ncbi:MAG: bacillithiol biosynthesis deacetylase BshB1 [Spirochaetota bacterium]